MKLKDNFSEREQELYDALVRAHEVLDCGHDHSIETWEDREQWRTSEDMRPRP